MTHADRTSPRARDVIIRRLYDERHRLLEDERAGSEVSAELQRVEDLINKHEMAEHQERFPNGTPLEVALREAEELLAELNERIKKKDSPRVSAD